MGQSLKLFFLTLSLLFTLSACTKKKSADKKSAVTPVTDTAKDKPANQPQAPLPPPSSPDSDADANSRFSRTPTPDRTLPLPESGSQTAPAQVDGSVVPPQTTLSTNSETQELSQFQTCASQKSNEYMAGAKFNQAKVLSSPLGIITVSNAVMAACSRAQNNNNLTHEKADLLRTQVTEAALKHFPDSSSVVSFYLEIENKVKNKALTEAEKNKIYEAFGSGVELESKGIQFFGALNKSKESANSISFVINRFTGTQFARLVSSDKETKSWTIDTSETSPALQLVFDFSVNKGNLYKLTFIDGETQIDTEFAFLPEKGDIKKLRAGEFVTVSLTRNSWNTLIAHQLRKLIKAKAPHLNSFPLSFSRTQETDTLSRTCTLNDKTIACSDPDYQSRSTVTPQRLLESIAK